MRAGKLDRRITIQRKSVTQSDSGQEVVAWVDVAVVSAEKIHVKGLERFAVQQLIGQALMTFKFRWSVTVSEITSTHRILLDGRDFDVTDVREIGRRQGIEIDALARSELPLIAAEEEVVSEFSLDFSNPANSGYLALLEEFGVSASAPFLPSLDFSDPANSGYEPLLEDT